MKSLYMLAVIVLVTVAGHPATADPILIGDCVDNSPGGSLIIGSTGNGSMDISSGAMSNTEGIVGVRPGSVGEVTVDGAGSTWTNSGRLTVGERGSGTVTVSNGGKVFNEWGRVGPYDGSVGEVTVDGAGSTWTNLLSSALGAPASTPRPGLRSRSGTPHRPRTFQTQCRGTPAASICRTHSAGGGSPTKG